MEDPNQPQEPPSGQPPSPPPGQPPQPPAGPPPPPPGQPPPPPPGGYPPVPPGQQWVPQPPVQQGQPGFAVVSLVTGIVGVLTSVCWCLGLPLCVAAIVFGVLGRNQAQERGYSTGMANAGLVLGIIGAAIGIILIVIGVATTSFNDIRSGS